MIKIFPNNQIFSAEYLNRLQDLCRLCLLQCKELDLYSDSYLIDKKWIDLLSSVTNNIYAEDKNKDYPKGICEECSSKLVLFYKFREKVAASYNTLSQICKNYAHNKPVFDDLKCDENSTENESLLEHDFIEEVSEGDDELSQYSENIYKLCKTESKKDSKIGNIDKEPLEEHQIEIQVEEDFDDDRNEKIICYLEIDEDENIFNDELRTEEEKKVIIESQPNFNENLRSNELNKTTKDKKVTKVKNIQCEICQARFTRNSSLKQHASVHSTEKKFECDLCLKKFTRRAHLDIHMLIHSNIRPHSCDECGRAFTKSGDLKRHKKIHLDVYEFMCLICNKEFKRKEYLTAHINYHYDFKPHKCKFCDKCYQSLSGLLKHKKSVHT